MTKKESDAIANARAEIAALEPIPICSETHAAKLLREDVLVIFDRMAAEIETPCENGEKPVAQRKAEAVNSARETLDGFQQMARILANVCARQLGAASAVYGDDWPDEAREVWLSLNEISGGSLLSPKEMERQVVSGQIFALQSFGYSKEATARGIAKYEKDLEALND